MTYHVELPVKVRREGVTDYYLEPPFEGAIVITVEARDEQEAIALATLEIARVIT